MSRDTPVKLAALSWTSLRQYLNRLFRIVNIKTHDSLVFLGVKAGGTGNWDATTTNSVYVGNLAGRDVGPSSIHNVGIGHRALEGGTAVTNTVALGSRAGLAYQGTNSVFIGDGCHALWTGSDPNKLIISTSISADPANDALIYGDFSVPSLSFNASLTLDATLTVNCTDPADVGIVVNGHATQTADRAQFLDSAGGSPVVIDAAGYVGINESSPGAMLDIKSAAATDVGLLVRGAVGQTANYFEIEDSGGVDVFTVAPSNGDTFVKGNMAVGGVAVTPSTFLISAGTAIDPVIDLFGAQFTRTMTYTSNNVRSITGGDFLVSTNASANGVTGVLKGGNFNVQNQLTGTVKTAYGGDFLVYNIGAGTITTAVGNNIRLFNLNASGVISNAYAVRVENFGLQNGTITNTYGVYVGDITLGTQTNTPFSFYAADAGALNYFAGKTGINETTPGAMLDIESAAATDIGLLVRGAAGQTADRAQFTDNAGTVTSGVYIDDEGSLLLGTTSNQDNNAPYMQIIKLNSLSTGGGLYVTTNQAVNGGEAVASFSSHASSAAADSTRHRASLNVETYAYKMTTDNLAKRFGNQRNFMKLFVQLGSAAHVYRNVLNEISTVYVDSSVGHHINNESFLYVQSLNVGTEGEIGSYYGYRSAQQLISSGTEPATINYLIDFHAAAITGTGNIPVRYGLRIDFDDSSTTAPWGVYQTEATVNNYFGGKVGINETSIGAMLDIKSAAATDIGLLVRGAAGQTADHIQVTDNGGTTPYLTLDSAGLLGLGTASPTEELHLVDNSASQAVLLESSGSYSGSFIVDMNRTVEDQVIANFIGRWNGTSVGRIRIVSGPDVTNKDDGKIDFMAASGGTLSTIARVDENGLEVQKGALSSVGLYDNGNSTSAKTIDWNIANHQGVTLNANCTLTFTDPPGSALMTLLLQQDAFGSRTVTWPANVYGTLPTLSTGATQRDLVLLSHDGTNYIILTTILNY